MNQQLIYEIAGHRFSIDTPDVQVTAGLIPTFAPFRVENDGKTGVLFQFSGNAQISIPDRAPDDVMELDGVSFHVYHNEGSLTVCMKNKKTEHIFKISADKKIATSDITLTQPYESQFLAYFLRTAFGMASANHQTIKLHASVIEKDGKALVFMGKSGTGKSTHSRLWQEFVPGCTLLNDDEPIVRIMNDGAVRVYGAPWSGSTPCYINAFAQVAAFVLLYQSPENKLTKLNGVKAFASLFQSAAILRSDQENREKVISTITGILEQVKVYQLDNLPNHEAVNLSQTLMR